MSSIALADIGNDVIGTNRQQLTTVAQLLVPTRIFSTITTTACDAGSVDYPVHEGS